MKCKVIINIHHNNERFNEGDEVELSLCEAKPLLDCKAIEPIIKPFTQNRLASNSSN